LVDNISILVFDRRGRIQWQKNARVPHHAVSPSLSDLGGIETFMSMGRALTVVNL
jgi:hypothetical protein